VFWLVAAENEGDPLHDRGGSMKRAAAATLGVVLGLAFVVASPPATVAAEEKTAAEAPMAFDQPPAVGTLAKCPVTGKTFTVEEKTKRSEHDGKHYVFCCPGCKPDFDKEPQKYLSQKNEDKGH
jgi:YHS domain-containing protein